MPHKHKRRGEADASQFDLPPTLRAKPLAVRESGKLSENFSSKTSQRKDKKKAKRVAGYGADDTPKAFARLMQLGQTGKGYNKGPDNGNEPRGKKRKLNEAKESKAQQEPAKEAPELPTILPGERISDFNARVDQALPVAGLARKGRGVGDRQTKTEKRIQKMIAEWRDEEVKIKEREEEERELAEEEADEQEAMWEDKTAAIPAKGKKKGKRKRQIGEVDDKEDDPWAVLKAKREEPKNINDVAQAPPTFNAIPKEKFKVRNGAKVHVDNIPHAAGSLRKREQLGEVRQSVIDSYRELMAAKRGAA